MGGFSQGILTNQQLCLLWLVRGQFEAYLECIEATIIRDDYVPGIMLDGRFQVVGDRFHRGGTLREGGSHD